MLYALACYTHIYTLSTGGLPHLLNLEGGNETLIDASQNPSLMDQSYSFLCQQTLNLTAGNGYILNFTSLSNQGQQAVLPRCA